MRARAALVCAVLAIVAGMAIAGVKIARADGGGACIYNAIVAPIAGYPSLPACDVNRNLGVQLKSGTTVAAIGSPGDGTNGNSLYSNAFAFGFNGTSWDRLRTTSSISGARVGMLAADLCDINNQPTCTAIGNPGASDGQNASAGGLYAGVFNLGYNGTNWDRMRSRSGERQVTSGGATLSKATATTCTSRSVGASVTLHKIWAAGTETATLQIYDEGSSPTCAAADLLWSGSPNSTPITLDAPVANGIAYKLSAAAAVNDYITSN